MAFKPVEILINAKDNASAVFGSLQAKVAAVGAAIAAYFGINAFAGVVKGAADLEAAMSRVEAATGATATEMAALRKAAEDAGASTKFTSTEAAGALENLAKAGLSSTQAIAALPAVLQLAQAGDVGLAESAEYVTKAVMGMGLAFEDAGRVADVLALGANATNTSVQGLAQALSYAAPVAQSAGLSLEGTTAILGKLADAGIDASRSGTALANMLAQFSDPASVFKRELSALGITTTDFEKALHQLAAAGPAGEKAILAVGLNAGPALRALLNQGMGALDELKGKLDNAAGSAAAAAATMQNNLNGSLSGLASAWDTVKNALGTPVLPVLKEGVDQLAGAFRNAVADGTVQRFGESIATAFKNGIQFVRDFLGTVDFSAVLARMQDFADSANQFFVKVGEYATNAGNTVQLAYGVMSAGANAVLTAIYGIGTAFTETAAYIVRAGISINEQLQKIAIGDAKERIARETEQMRLVLEGLGDAGERFKSRMRQSFIATGEAAQLARDGFSGLAGSTQEAEHAATAGAAAFDDMGKRLEEVRQKSQQAQKAVEDKAAKDAQAKQAAVEHAAAVADLSKSYADAVTAGNWQRAAELQEQINRKLRETPAAGKDAARAAADTAAAIEAAFRALGVTSSAQLKQTAAEAQRAYETIRGAGTNTAQDVANAFQVAAERAIEANNGIAPAWVRAEAAVRGFRIEADDTGKSIVVNMKDAERAVGNVGKAAKGAAPGFKAMGDAAEDAGDKIDRLRQKEKRRRDENSGGGGDGGGGGGYRGGGPNPLSPSSNDPKKLLDYYEKFKPTDSKDFQKAVEDARNTRTGNVEVLPEIINAEVERRLGAEFVGNKVAERVLQLRNRVEQYNKYGGPRSKEGMAEANAVRRELDRAEAELEQERQKLSAQRRASSQTTASDAGQGARPASSPFSGVAGAQVVNLNYNGVPLGSVSTDASGRAALQKFMDALTGDRGTSR